MKCPRCHYNIVNGFYCVHCGYVPVKAPNHKLYDYSHSTACKTKHDMLSQIMTSDDKTRQ